MILIAYGLHGYCNNENLECCSEFPGSMAFNWGDDSIDIGSCKPYYFNSPRILTSRAAVFSAGGHLSPWVSMLLLLGGDIQTNLGPPVVFVIKLSLSVKHQSNAIVYPNTGFI